MHRNDAGQFKPGGVDAGAGLIKDGKIDRDAVRDLARRSQMPTYIVPGGGVTGRVRPDSYIDVLRRSGAPGAATGSGVTQSGYPVIISGNQVRSATPAGTYDPFVVYGTKWKEVTEPKDAKPIPAREEAMIALKAGDWEHAADRFRYHLKTSPDDAAAQRLLAVSLVESRRIWEAASAALRAYEVDPALAAIPLDPTEFDRDRTWVSGRARDAQTFAARSKSAGGYVLALMLVQAEGNSKVAASLLARARAAGLSARAVEEWELAIKP
ncbi:MAG: hypothetical protein JNM07_00055 [Phycisphaerae bacterium]|nr:hypothetical protein [Phycisphaerae bacterium]